MRLLIIVFSSCFMLLFGCESNRKEMLPVARGEDDEMILVIDSAQWNSELGNTLRDMYGEYMRGLPQDEQKFRLNKVNPQNLNSVLTNVKNLIFVMTLDSRTAQSRAIREYFTENSLKMISKDSSIFYTVRKDEFAKGQIVLFLFGQTEEQLVEQLKDGKSQLVELFESAVRERTRERITAKTRSELINAIEEDHGYEIVIPMGYDLAKNLKNFVWIRNLQAQSELNVFIYDEPYTDEQVFNKTAELRDQITETYLRDSENPDVYINRQEIIPVFTERVTFQDRFTVETRGLWKISDSSGGGPFISYTFVDDATQKLYYIEGYVYSPGTNKKDLIREVEAIISSFRIKDKPSS